MRSWLGPALAVTLRNGSTDSHRLIARDIQDRVVQRKLMDEIGPRFVSRPGVYTRLYRLGTCGGDAVQEASIELVNDEA